LSPGFISGSIYSSIIRVANTPLLITNSSIFGTIPSRRTAEDRPDTDNSPHNEDDRPVVEDTSNPIGCTSGSIIRPLRVDSRPIIQTFLRVGSLVFGSVIDIDFISVRESISSG
jgi:hypothetical protein